jgi:hypothetical protein
MSAAGGPRPFDTLAGAWAVYRRSYTLPMPPTVEDLLRRSFYIGAGAMFDLMMEAAAGEGDGLAAENEARMERLHGELAEHVRSIVEDYAGRAAAAFRASGAKPS